MNKKLLFFLKFLVSAALIVLLIQFVDWENVWGYVMQVDVVYLAVFVALILTGILISSAKWKFLAHSQNMDNSLWYYFRLYIIGAFINNFLPSFLGGDAYRMYTLGKKEDRMRSATHTVIIDRLSGLGGVLVLSALFGAILMMRESVGATLHIIMWIIFFITTLLVVIVYFFNTSFVKNIINVFPQKVAQYILVMGAFRTRSIMIPTFLYSILFAFVGLALSNYVLFLAIGIEINFLSFLSVIFIISIISAIPISIGNIGVKEWAYVTLFAFFGVSASAAVTVVILSRILQMLISFAALPLYLSEKRNPEPEMTKNPTEGSESYF